MNYIWIQVHIIFLIKVNTWIHQSTVKILIYKHLYIVCDFITLWNIIQAVVSLGPPKASSETNNLLQEVHLDADLRKHCKRLENGDSSHYPTES